MRDAEWTLAYEGVSLSFGGPGSSIVLDGPPDLGSSEIQVDDANRPREDGIAFGIDFRGAVTITFALAIVADDEAGARDLAALVSRVWRGDAVRRTPGGLATLSSRLGSRDRVVFGRPRRFAQDDTHAPEGVILLTADFQCVNDVSYSTEATVESVTLVPPPSGGLMSPLSAPLTTVAPASRPGGIEVGGELPAWPVVEIEGPVTDPEVQVTNEWTLALRADVPEGDAVVIDSRPWKRSITRRSDGASLAGVLTRSSVPLSKTGLAPGGYEISLRGIDGTGTASMRFSWHDTYSALS
jgi:hypothetical protein